jgi:hypothetical protein
VDALLHQEYSQVTRQTATAASRLSALRHSCDSDTFAAVAGAHLLHLFVLDLLGTRSAAAVVFRAKAEQE